MELLEGLKTRRSVRQYDSAKKIPHEDIEKILEAASYGPSAHNKQPWEFLVIEDAETLASLRSIQPWTSFAKNASCAIIVCSNTDEAFHRDKENEKWFRKSLEPIARNGRYLYVLLRFERKSYPDLHLGIYIFCNAAHCKRQFGLSGENEYFQ